DAIGSQVLVAEAAGDLEVALEAGDREQLLEDLRRLRQREEAALLEPGGDEEVAGAFRCRLEQDRRLDLEEAGALHHPADGRDHLRAETQVALQPRPAEVDPAIA